MCNRLGLRPAGELGHRELGELRYVLYETKGELTVVPESGTDDGGLVTAGLADAAGFDHGSRAVAQ
jgi:hypothetical protein